MENSLKNGENGDSPRCAHFPSPTPHPRAAGAGSPAPQRGDKRVFQIKEIKKNERGRPCDQITTHTWHINNPSLYANKGQSWNILWQANGHLELVRVQEGTPTLVGCIGGDEAGEIEEQTGD